MRSAGFMGSCVPYFGFYWVYIGIMEKEMETTIIYSKLLRGGLYGGFYRGLL